MNIDHKFRYLIAKFLEVQNIARQQGIFVDDRELLECSQCQLMEDVAFDGRLFTYMKGDKDFKDIGLRFIELNQSRDLFKCPNCGMQITVPEEKEY